MGYTAWSGEFIVDRQGTQLFSCATRLASSSAAHYAIASRFYVSLAPGAVQSKVRSPVAADPPSRMPQGASGKPGDDLWNMLMHY